MTRGAAPVAGDAAARARWVESLRAPGERVDPWSLRASFREAERQAEGEVVPVLALLLAGAECPWRCVFCDLWKGATRTRTPAGAIPAQVAAGIASSSGPVPARVLKLYNSGSWFDPSAVPPEDDPAVARLARGFGRLVVESHPALVRARALRLRDLLGRTRLEVAMGLESADAGLLARLGKRMTPASFARAARFLRTRGVDVRAFVLVGPPFVPPGEAAVGKAVSSARFAFESGAQVVSLVAVRGGNGAMEELRNRGEWTPPRLEELEAAFAGALALGAGRVFADTWDLAPISRCPACLPGRRARLEAMNHAQSLLPITTCNACGGGSIP